MDKIQKIMKNKKYIFIFLILIILLIFGYKFFIKNKPTTSNNLKTETKNILNYVIKPGDTFLTIAQHFGLTNVEIQNILNRSKKIFDFSKIQIGNLIKFTFTNNVLAAIEYFTNDDKKIIIEPNNNFNVYTTPVDYTIKLKTVKVILHNSLFQDSIAQGLSPKIIMNITDILGWDIDFATDIRDNDNFTVIYQEKYYDNKLMGDGKIIALRFSNQNKNYWAFYFNYNNTDGYFDLDGHNIAKQFLKSPLQYSYISSGFSYNRLNPITKEYGPHRAVDYAAPYGTPVHATADGVILIAGWHGTAGIFVEIKHANGFITGYAHLSKIPAGIKVGSKVKQGQLIGYVGATGEATGPHLHYQVLHNGNYINPLIYKFPNGNSIPKEYILNFQNTIEQYKNNL
ncbi:MAG: peptidoglycan DD-metalloendopeptidase family protein [Minisyncoccia bacterium]